MAEILPVYTGKKGPKTYKAARGTSGRGNFGNIGQKKATDKRNSKIDKKVKRISNKIVKFKSKTPGPASHNRY